MFSKIFTLSLSLSLAVSTINSSMACDIHGQTGIVENNSLYIPVGLKSFGGITETQFNKVIDRIATLYKTKAQSLGVQLIFNKNWTDGTVNAFAHRDQVNDKLWNISMFGGLARHPQMTEDGFAVVVCHELGHHLGGAPKKSNSTGEKRWASNEGQADYFATLKCLRKFFAGSNNQEVISKLNVPKILVNACRSSYANNEEVAICIRTSMAGEVLGNFFNALRNSTESLSFATPDKKIVSVTNDAHPASQCRLDTYFQGSLCDKNVNEEVSDTDANIGTCTRKNGDTVGLRPTCWFAE